MKRTFYFLIKPALKAVIAVERSIFLATGLKMRSLAAYYRAEARHIQRQLDQQRSACAEGARA